MTTHDLRNLLSLVEKYDYEGPIDWIVPKISLSLPLSDYEKKLNEYREICQIYKEDITRLSNSPEEEEVKQERIKMLDQSLADLKKYMELNEKAKEIVERLEKEDKLIWTEIYSHPEYEAVYTPLELFRESGFKKKYQAVAFPTLISSFEEIG